MSESKVRFCTTAGMESRLINMICTVWNRSPESIMTAGVLDPNDLLDSKTCTAQATERILAASHH